MKQQLYIDYLKGEGYLPEPLANGDVQFKLQGEAYVITSAESDPNYFKVSYYHSWNQDQAEQSIRLINAINARLKVVKVSSLQDVICFTTETFLAEPEDFSKIFPRCINMIGVAKGALADGLRQLAIAASQAAETVSAPAAAEEPSA